MKFASSLLKFSAPLFILASCQKGISDFVSKQTPAKPTDTIAVKPPVAKPPKDTATLMIRDAMWYENSTSAFFLEPLEVEKAVPQANWLRCSFDASGTHTINAKTSTSVIPQMENLEYGFYDDRYFNNNHTNTLGYGNNALPVDVFISRNDSGVVAYGVKYNSATGTNDTVRRATTVRLIAAEKVQIITPPTSAGKNPMNNGSSHEVKSKTNLRPNSALGQNGVTYYFPN